MKCKGLNCAYYAYDSMGDCYCCRLLKSLWRHLHIESFPYLKDTFLIYDIKNYECKFSENVLKEKGYLKNE